MNEAEKKERLAAVAPELLDAVAYALRRVQSDPDFRHHMHMTETMDRLCRAYAIYSGEPFEQVREQCSVDRQPEHRKRKAALVVALREVAVLERVLSRLTEGSQVSWERVEELRAEVEKELHE